MCGTNAVQMQLAEQGDLTLATLCEYAPSCVLADYIQEKKEKEQDHE